jgi:hypothetical protein
MGASIRITKSGLQWMIRKMHDHQKSKSSAASIHAFGAGARSKGERDVLVPAVAGFYLVRIAFLVSTNQPDVKRQKYTPLVNVLPSKRAVYSPGSFASLTSIATSRPS